MSMGHDVNSRGPATNIESKHEIILKRQLTYGNTVIKVIGQIAIQIVAQCWHPVDNLDHFTVQLLIIQTVLCFGLKQLSSEEA